MRAMRRIDSRKDGGKRVFESALIYQKTILLFKRQTETIVRKMSFHNGISYDLMLES